MTIRKIFSFNSGLDKVTGVQKVMLDIHKAVKDTYETKIVGILPYNQINKEHHIERDEYMKFANPFMFYRSIVVVHERKFLLMSWILNHILFQKIKIVYVHHNIFHNHRLMSIMPQTVVSISDRCTENLKSFFNVPSMHIHKIYNCVIDIHPQSHKYNDNGIVTLVYPARINNVKRQIEIFRQLKGRLDQHIRILFAGVGPEYKQLKTTLNGDKQFVALGFVNDIPSLLQDNDYMMLFSKHEGLPITLIEAAMCYTPIICNDVGGNTEIAHNGENAFVVNDWNVLIQKLNELPNIKKEDYLKMSVMSRKIYEDNFTFEKFRKHYLDLFAKLR